MNETENWTIESYLNIVQCDKEHVPSHFGIFMLQIDILTPITLRFTVTKWAMIIS